MHMIINKIHVWNILKTPFGIYLYYNFETGESWLRSLPTNIVYIDNGALTVAARTPNSISFAYSTSVPCNTTFTCRIDYWWVSRGITCGDCGYRTVKYKVISNRGLFSLWFLFKSNILFLYLILKNERINFVIYNLKK